MSARSPLFAATVAALAAPRFATGQTAARTLRPFYLVWSDEPDAPVEYRNAHELELLRRYQQSIEADGVAASGLGGGGGGGGGGGEWR
jgi:hypothetical protein